MEKGSYKPPEAWRKRIGFTYVGNRSLACLHKKVLGKARESQELRHKKGGMAAKHPDTVRYHLSMILVFRTKNPNLSMYQA